MSRRSHARKKLRASKKERTRAYGRGPSRCCVEAPDSVDEFSILDQSTYCVPVTTGQDQQVGLFDLTESDRCLKRKRSTSRRHQTWFQRGEANGRAR
jgi:hypothetical protein